jgi:hypothetical protein
LGVARQAARNDDARLRDAPAQQAREVRARSEHGSLPEEAMIHAYDQDSCRAGGEFARRDGGFDAVKAVVNASGIAGLELLARAFRELRPHGTRAEFTRFVIVWINKPDLFRAAIQEAA